MICVSVAPISMDQLDKLLEGSEFAEIRMEALHPDGEQMKEIFARPIPMIAVCRPGTMEEQKRIRMLIMAVEAGAKYVDIEIETETENREEVLFAARKTGCSVIVSYHNKQSTPSVDQLRSIVNQCFKAGANIAKIACMVEDPKENARLLSLLDDSRGILPVGMGEAGRITRIAAVKMGAPFTYAHSDHGFSTAPGQFGYSEMKRLLLEVGG